MIKRYITSLTEEILQNLGFNDAGLERKTSKNKIWRVKFPYYAFHIQVVLKDLPSNNPNCGVVSIYMPPGNAIGFNKKGKKKLIHFKELNQPIAWYVDSTERLKQIIISLTQSNL